MRYELMLPHQVRTAVERNRPVVLPPARHRAYALQWGLLALAVVAVALAASARRVPAVSGEIAHEQP